MIAFHFIDLVFYNHYYFLIVVVTYMLNCCYFSTLLTPSVLQLFWHFSFAVRLSAFSLFFQKRVSRFYTWSCVRERSNLQIIAHASIWVHFSCLLTSIILSITCPAFGVSKTVSFIFLPCLFYLLMFQTEVRKYNFLCLPCSYPTASAAMTPSICSPHALRWKDVRLSPQVTATNK